MCFRQLKHGLRSPRAVCNWGAIWGNMVTKPFKQINLVNKEFSASTQVTHRTDVAYLKHEAAGLQDQTR